MDKCICRNYDGSGIDQHGNRSCPVHNQSNTPLPHRDMGKGFTHIEDTFDNSVLSTICGCRHDKVTTAATTSHEHTEACQNATEVKRQLLTELLDGLPEEYTGWTNFGKHDLNYPEEGYNKALTEVTSVIQALLDGLK